MSQPASGSPSLALISSNNNFLLNSIFANSPDHAKSGEPTIIVSPADAATFKLTDATLVKVSNDRGQFVARLAVKDEVRAGVAVTSKGLWAKHNRGNNVNATIMERDSDMGQGAVFHDNKVRIEPWSM